MADFTMTVPDADLARVTKALCAAGGFTDVSPENAKATVMRFIEATVSNVETAAAQQAALAAIADAAPVTLS